MDPADELDAIAVEMGKILDGPVPVWGARMVAVSDAPRFAELVQDARSILSEHLGPTNDFGHRIDAAEFKGRSKVLGEAGRLAAYDELIAITRSGAKTIRRKVDRPSPETPAALAMPPYVSLTRITQLRAMPSSPWDLSRLVRMCEELNSVFAAGNYLATAMLVRAIVDHVPPVFNEPSFARYASRARRSIKDSVSALDTASRPIASRWLHDQIRQKETLPTETQIDFRQQLDVLLGEVIAAVGSAEKPSP